MHGDVLLKHLQLVSWNTGIPQLSATTLLGIRHVIGDSAWGDKGFLFFPLELKECVYVMESLFTKKVGDEHRHGIFRCELKMNSSEFPRIPKNPQSSPRIPKNHQDFPKYPPNESLNDPRYHNSCR